MEARQNRDSLFSATCAGLSTLPLRARMIGKKAGQEARPTTPGAGHTLPYSRTIFSDFMPFKALRVSTIKRDRSTSPL